MKKKIWVVMLLILVLLAVSGCLASSTDVAATAQAGEEVAGFWMGLWQGFIAPFAFLISLFNHDIGIYEVVNNGGWYNFGYLIGLTLIFGGSGGGAGRRSRRRSRQYDR